MNEQEKYRFMTVLQNRKSLADAGVILIEEPSTEVLRWPKSTDPKFFVILYKLNMINGSWSELSARNKLQFQLSRVGVRLTDMALAGLIDGVYACFIGVGGSSGAGVSAFDTQAALLQATNDMQQTQMSFNLQYLSFQNQMQNESRTYELLSNIMKTRHDTVKNTISNIR